MLASTKFVDIENITREIPVATPDKNFERGGAKIFGPRGNLESGSEEWMSAGGVSEEWVSDRHVPKRKKKHHRKKK